MAVNGPGASLKSPRSPRQLPKLPISQRNVSGERSPGQSIHNFACKSPSTPRVFTFPPEYHPETPNANFDLDDYSRGESFVDSRSSLLPDSTSRTSSIGSNAGASYRSSIQPSSSGGKIRGSPDHSSGSPIFQFCNPKKTFDESLGYPPKSPMSAGPPSINRSRSPTQCGSPHPTLSQKSPKPAFERARRNSCFSLGPIRTPMSPTTIVTAPTESSDEKPRSADGNSKRWTRDFFDKNTNPDCIDDNEASPSGHALGKLELELNDASGMMKEMKISSRREHERDRSSSRRSRSERMGSVSLNKSHGSLNDSATRNEENVFSGISDGSGNVGGKCNPGNVARRSTNDLAELDNDEVETEVTFLSSPRRRGSMKGGLAYLASRRGSRDSQISNVSNVSNEDIGPLNFSAHPRGRQRRTSNFLELPVPDHIRPRVHSLPEKPYNPRAGDDLYRLRAFSITHKGVVNRGDSIISRRSRSNTSVNSSRNSNVSGERSPFDGSCCSGQGVTADSTESDIDEIPKYRVVLLGDSGVGKTALVSQFMTSEYMNTYDASLDDEFGEKTVSILLDGEESEMIFIDHPYVEMSVENSLSTYEPHGCVVVYSIVSRASFQVAEETLNYLWREHFTQDRSVIVVGNKADLARSRTITANEGKQLATSRECKFIETSSGIQHNVDELLVGILKQIRLRATRDKKLRRQGSKGKMLSKLHGSKTALSLTLARDILNKMCLNDSKSKSCENLHVL